MPCIGMAFYHVVKCYYGESSVSAENYLNSFLMKSLKIEANLV